MLNAQQKTQHDITTLDRALTAAAQSAEQSPAATGHSGAGAGTSSPSHGAGTGGGATITAAQLAADQAAIDAATAQLAVAQQAVDSATLLSPVAGTVVQVNLVVGQRVPANSANATVVVDAPSGYQVTAQVPVAQISSVKPGQRVQVTPDGGSARTGTVTSVGLLANITGNSTTYPVVIGLSSTAGVYHGSNASVAISTSTSGGDVLVVPTSAVSTNGPVHTVQVYASGVVTSTRVQVGPIGPVYTQITSGLSVGQQVVLADLTAPLPVSSTTNLRGGPKGGGPKGGGAAPAGRRP